MCKITQRIEVLFRVEALRLYSEQLYWENFSTKDEVVVEHCMLYFDCASFLEMVKKERKVHAK